MADDEAYLNIHETAEVLGVTRRRIWHMVKVGELHAISSPLDRREKLISRAQVDQLAKFSRSSRQSAAGMNPR